ncbi:MAG: 50S ribosomal protein L1 [Fimbriimonadaceae bacterium]|nr:50S ribosomal protein L1 [Fimbriimonadaceae bacterium]
MRSKTKVSKRYAAISSLVDKNKLYEIDEALALVRQTATTKKLKETVDLAIRLGIDPRKSDQNVRGITNLPHGTGKIKKVAVLAKGDLAKEAEAAGADFVGDEDLIKRIQEGWKGFDIMLATSDMAPQIGKVGKFLGPKTPNKRNNTVTDAIGQAVKEIKGATRVEYRAEKAGIVHLSIGKVSFSDEQLKENLIAALDAVIKAKPSSSKGRYLQSITISSTMGPGIKLEPTLASKASGH